MSGLTFKIKRFPFLSFFFSSSVLTRHGSYKELGSLLFSSRSIQTSRISKSNRSRNEPNSNIGLVWHSRAHQAYTRPSSVNDGYTASHPLTRELFFFPASNWCDYQWMQEPGPSECLVSSILPVFIQAIVETSNESVRLHCHIIDSSMHLW